MAQQVYQSSETTSIRDILSVVFKHKKKIVLVALCIFVGVTLFALAMPWSYKAKSVLLIKLGREFMSGPEVGGRGGEAGFSVRPDTIIRGEISILTSRDLMEKVIKMIGARNLYPDLGKETSGNMTPEQAALTLFAKNLSVQNITGSSLIEVSFSHVDPYMAAKVVNTLVNEFKDKHLEVFGANSTAFLEGQQKVFREKLKKTEGVLADFKQKNRVFSFEEQKTALIQQRSTIDTNLKAANSQISELAQKVEFIKSPSWTADVPADLQTRLAALQQRERELQEKYTENSRALQSVRQELQILKDSIRKTSEDQRRAEIGKVQGELVLAKVRAESLSKQLGQIDGEIQSLASRSRELHELQREATQQEQSYQTYAKKLEESLIMDDMDKRKMVAISVIENASVSATAKEKKFGTSQMAAAGFFGGIAAGIALAFLLEMTSSVMTTPYSAERRLGLPVMVAITKKA